VTYETTVGTDGTYSVDTETETPTSGTFPTNLDDNDTIAVTVTDEGGNQDTAVVNIDTEAPMIDDENTNDATPTITGVGEPGETLTVELDTDGDGIVDVTYETAVASDGTYSVDPDSDTPTTGLFPTDLVNDDVIGVTVTDAGGNQDTADISIVQVADLAIAKSVAGDPILTELGNYVVTFEVVVENTGTVDLASLSLLETLSTQFGPAFVDASNLTLVGSPSDPVSNITLDSAGWNGSTATEIIADSAATRLATGDSFTLQFDVEVDPREISAALVSQIEGSASGVDASGNPILDSAGNQIIGSDLSDSGTDPGTSNPDDPSDQGTSDDPTLFDPPPVPLSAISGTVFQDDNNDGFQQLGEGGIGGVILTLTGTDVFGDAVSIQTTTDATGRYVFAALNAGEYSITQTQPDGFTDGIDIDSNGLVTPINDVLSNISLGFGETISSATFAERQPGASGNPPTLPGLPPIAWTKA